MTNEKKVSSMKLAAGSIRRRGSNGFFTYRCQVNGRRKEFALQTADVNEAIRKANELVPITQARTIEVVAAHVNEARGFAKQASDLLLTDTWEKYARHPERAMPHTVSEQLAYQSTFAEFVEFATRPQTADEKKHRIGHTAVTLLRDVTPTVAGEFAAWLKSRPLAVDTHNRKLKRIRKVLDVLHEYYGSAPNPFRAKSLFRNIREEQGSIVRRQAFTREQEQQLIVELQSPKHRLINKDEIRIVYTIGMFTGQRLKDCVLLQWQNVDMNRHRIYVKQFKTGREVSIPLSRQLFEILQEAEAWKCDQYVCPKTAARYNKIDENGKNVGNNLVDIDVLRVIRWIGLEPSVTVPGRKKKMTIYGFHSLRHSFASFCAEAGVPKAVLLSILGTESDIADKYYTHVGDEAQEKAIAAVCENRLIPNATERIQHALSYLNSTAIPSGIADALRQILTGEVAFGRAYAG